MKAVHDWSLSSTCISCTPTRPLLFTSPRGPGVAPGIAPGVTPGIAPANLLLTHSRSPTPARSHGEALITSGRWGDGSLTTVRGTWEKGPLAMGDSSLYHGAVYGMFCPLQSRGEHEHICVCVHILMFCHCMAKVHVPYREIMPARQSFS